MKLTLTLLFVLIEFVKNLNKNSNIICYIKLDFNN